MAFGLLQRFWASVLHILGVQPGQLSPEDPPFNTIGAGPEEPPGHSDAEPRPRPEASASKREETGAQELRSVMKRMDLRHT